MTISNHDMSVLDTSTKKVLTDLFAKPNFLERVPGTFGGGAIGTGSWYEPRTYQGELNGNLITEIHVDITGLGCKGTAQGDVIGLNTGGLSAEIGRHNINTYGIVYRIEMICLETPTQKTATYELDIDVMGHASQIAYDGAATRTLLASAANHAIGKITVSNTPAITENDYLYLGEGDTGATTGVYGGGQFIIRFIGHRALTA